MTASEMCDKLEELSCDLNILLGTTTAVMSAMDDGSLSPEKSGYAMLGILRDIEGAISYTDYLVDKTLKSKPRSAEAPGSTRSRCANTRSASAEKFC